MHEPSDTPWSTDSWRARAVDHQPQYADPAALAHTLDELQTLPPIVFPGEIDQLREQIADAARGGRFILHGGDCVERFVDCRAEAIADKLKILLQMSVVLSHAARRPVLRIGRMAGQYFKPRSSDTESTPDGEIPSYKGDAINGFAASERAPDPYRLLRAYFHSAATLNYVRAMIDGGFADLHHPFAWNLRSIERSPRWEEYEAIVENILDAIHFMESFGGVRNESLGRIDFYTSHEGLHLPYEEALTRREGDRWYDTSAHLLWIGERTRRLDGGHVEFFRGIYNPVAVKLSAAALPEDVLRLSEMLNPANEAGRLVFITRLGATQAREKLRPLIETVEGSDRRVAWICDPMHGNTITAAGGHKTRPFDAVLDELETTFAVHRNLGTTLAGVHFELTGDDVTECIGGAGDLAESDLGINYQSWCDPRLNNSQSMEMAFLSARFLRERGGTASS